jgi:methionine-rich copper-binding protein CopC
MGLLLALLSASALATTQAAAHAATRSAVQEASAKAADSAKFAGPARAAVEAARSAVTVRQTDTSPAASVVARAPEAVSVTFSGAIAQDGAELRIFGPDGEVGAAQPQVQGNAIRRPLDRDVPKGEYEVVWEVRSAAGQKLSGSFSFTAARGHGAGADEEPEPTAEPTEAMPTEQSETEPTVALGPGAGEPGAGQPGAGEPQAGPVAGTALSGQYMVVPIALGAGLVLASALVGLISTGRRPELFVYRGFALARQRHQQ